MGLHSSGSDVFQTLVKLRCLELVFLLYPVQRDHRCP